MPCKIDLEITFRLETPSAGTIGTIELNAISLPQSLPGIGYEQLYAVLELQIGELSFKLEKGRVDPITDDQIV